MKKNEAIEAIMARMAKDAEELTKLTNGDNAEGYGFVYSMERPHDDYQKMNEGITEVEGWSSGNEIFLTDVANEITSGGGGGTKKAGVERQMEILEEMDVLAEEFKSIGKQDNRVGLVFFSSRIPENEKGTVAYVGHICCHKRTAMECALSIGKHVL